MLRGGWYTGLGYRYVSGGGGRRSSAWAVRSSHIGCSERTGQLLPGLPVNSASWLSVGTKPACVQLLQQRQGAIQLGCYLQSAAHWSSFELQPAATMGFSYYAKSKLPAMELSLDCSWDWGVLYF